MWGAAPVSTQLSEQRFRTPPCFGRLELCSLCLAERHRAMHALANRRAECEEQGR